MLRGAAYKKRAKEYPGATMMRNRSNRWRWEKHAASQFLITCAVAQDYFKHRSGDHLTERGLGALSLRSTCFAGGWGDWQTRAKASMVLQSNAGDLSSPGVDEQGMGVYWHKCSEICRVSGGREAAGRQSVFERCAWAEETSRRTN